MPVNSTSHEGTLRLTAGAIAVIALCLGLIACKTLNQSAPTVTLMRTDTTEIRVGRSDQLYGARIGFVLVNTTAGAISSGMCMPNVEKSVTRKGKQVWEAISFGVVMGCDATGFREGETYRERALFSAPSMERYMSPDHWINTIDGTYRLRWPFVEGKDLTSGRARRINAVSNEFHMTLPAPQVPGCSADTASARIYSDGYASMVSRTDSQSVAQRVAFRIPMLRPSQVTVVTDYAVCRTASAAFDRAFGVSALNEAPIVLQLGNQWAVIKHLNFQHYHPNVIFDKPFTTAIARIWF